MATTYTVEMRCCKETNWVEAHCTNNLIGQGCTVSDTTATVIGLKANTEYYFRVYAVYKNWKSAVSLSSKAVKTKSEDRIKFFLKTFTFQVLSLSSYSHNSKILTEVYITS